MQNSIDSVGELSQLANGLQGVIEDTERCLLIDISPKGLRLERRNSLSLPVGSIVTLSAEGNLKNVFPDCRAIVLWLDGTFCGLEFETGLPLSAQELRKVVCP